MPGTGLSFWLEPDNDWDSLIVDGELWPGVVTVSSGSAERSLDLKKAPGSDLSRIVDNGYKNASFSVTFTIWTEEQWRELQDKLASIHPRKKGGSRDPLSIAHPAINMLGVENCYVKKVNMPKLDKRTQILTLTIELLEWIYVPPPVKPATGTGAGSGLTPEEQRALDELLALGEATILITQANAAFAEAGFPPV